MPKETLISPVRARFGAWPRKADIWNKPFTPAELAKIEGLVTEDDTPVPNIFTEKQRRLLAGSLYDSWTGPAGGRKFLLFTNVGLFYDLDKPPLVPDALVSLDVEIPKDIWSKSKRSYFLRGYGKPPEVVIQVVSDKKGDEAGEKMRKYAQIKVPHYVIFDPFNYLKKGKLQIYRLRGNKYAKQKGNRLSEAELSLTLWTGVYENVRDRWLRWCDRKGNLLLTGEELMQREREHRKHWQAEQEQQRADQECREKELAQQRVERLTAQLRALGINPDG